MITLLVLAISVLLGTMAVVIIGKGDDGLLLLCVCASLVVAALGGALTPFLPEFIGLWTGRVALGCVAFVVTCFVLNPTR